jgi:hypothetical protein
MRVPFSLSRVIMSGLLLGMVLSVCTCWFHNMVTIPPWLVSTDFGTCSYQRFLSNCTPVSLHMLKCSCALTLSCLFMYCSFASIGHYYYYYYYRLLVLFLLIYLFIWFTIILYPNAPSLLYNGYRVSLPGVQRPWHVVDHPTPFIAEVKERVELYLYSLSGPSWRVEGWT